MAVINFAELRPQKGMSQHSLLGLLADHRRTREGTGLVAATRAATAATAWINNHDCGHLVAFLNLSAVPGGVANGLSVWLMGYDPVSATAFGMGGYGLKTGVATGAFTWLFGQSASLNTHPYVIGTSSMKIPRTFQLWVYHGDAGDFTYSLGYCLIP